MGLDCVWLKPEGETTDVPVDFTPKHIGIGMVASCMGMASFRGKIYADFFEEQLEVNLYEDMTNQDVLTVADRLDRLLDENPTREVWTGDFHDVSREEVQELRDMFWAFGEKGSRLHAWY